MNKMHSQSDRPKVSVWIVTYNHEKFIAQCIESVIMQKVNFTFDIIIGEDCSTDNTRKIIQEIEAKYPDIIKPIYHQTNVGAYRNAYEFCYPKLTGDYIACLEGDDYWLDEYKLQKQVDALERDSNAALCFTQVKVLNEDKNEFEPHWSISHNKSARYTVTDILSKFNIVTCSILFRNVYPVQLPYNAADFPTGDVSLCAFIMLKGDAIFLNEEMAVYRMHGSGIYSPITLEKKNLVHLKIFEQFLKEPLFLDYRNLLKTLYADRAYQALCFEIKKQHPDILKVKEYYSQAIRYFNLSNTYYPVKAILRKNLYQLTGKSFGRQLN
jgi:glycosyltransferase involved in cell wall biosynthesis